MVFAGGGTGHIAYEAKGELGKWHDKFYVPDGESQTLSELRAINHAYEAQFWGHALDDFAKWYQANKMK